MAEHSVPAGKLCPFISTAQIVIQNLAIQGISKGKITGSPEISLGGIQGFGSGAKVAAETKLNTDYKGVQVGFGYKNKIPSEILEKVQLGKIKPEEIPPEFLKPIPDSLSVPCLRSKCELWCQKHDTRDCGGGCQECKLEVMTKAFSAAMANNNQHQENPA